jgi:hypothetical protein
LIRRHTRRHRSRSSVILHYQTGGER